MSTADALIGAGVAGELADAVERLAADARGGERRLVSATAEISTTDPAAVVFASRRSDDRWFCWERPARGRLMIAGLGSALELVSRGPARFDDLVADTTRISSRRLAEEPKELPVGAGPLFVGGAAFDPDGAAAPEWSSLPPALLHVPEVGIRCGADGCQLTVAAMAGAGADASEVAGRMAARLAGLRASPIPALDPDPAGTPPVVRSSAPPSDYEAAVATAVRHIRGGELKKLVLAREVVVEGSAAIQPAPLFGALRELFESCFCFCVGTPEASFIGASPELLIRRAGGTAATVALAGSARRSADPSVDDHLGEGLRSSAKDREEHRIVVERIRRRLSREAVWVEAAAEPEIVKVANIQHLATPITAQLADPPSALQLAARLHPTPAVGGEPDGAGVQRLIRELERIDRGWYAGPVGWMDMAEDGEFCVALRSGLLRDRQAHLYAGAGIVADSDPAAELAETEVKLGALLPLVTG